MRQTAVSVSAVAGPTEAPGRRGLLYQASPCPFSRRHSLPALLVLQPAAIFAPTGPGSWWSTRPDGDDRPFSRRRCPDPRDESEAERDDRNLAELLQQLLSTNCGRLGFSYIDSL